jgi:hypothetical protein
MKHEGLLELFRDSLRNRWRWAASGFWFDCLDHCLFCDELGAGEYDPVERSSTSELDQQAAIWAETGRAIVARLRSEPSPEEAHPDGVDKGYRDAVLNLIGQNCANWLANPSDNAPRVRRMMFECFGCDEILSRFISREAG